MKSRSTQFGVRENTASSRQHASRLAVGSHSDAICVEEGSGVTFRLSIQDTATTTGIDDPLNAALENPATEGEKSSENHLLTVSEVAELLQVPVSWVYGRMRKRSSERLPGYRLGKYWRFREGEVLEWVECHRGGSHAT
jgi:excisionase family DNA binding protein